MLRLIGMLFGAAGLAALAADWLIYGGPRDLGAWWADLHFASLQLLEPAIARHLSPFLWDPVMTTVLLTPAWIVGLAIWAFLMLMRRALG